MQSYHYSNGDYDDDVIYLFEFIGNCTFYEFILYLSSGDIHGFVERVTPAAAAPAPAVSVAVLSETER